MKTQWRDRSRLWLDLGQQALLSLQDHRLRTSLSVLGIAIGIAAVILIGVVSEGGRQMVFSELETFGLKSTWIFRDRRVLDPRRVVREGSGIDNDDYAAIRQSACCPEIGRLTPSVKGGRNVPPFVRTDGRYAQAETEGVGHDYLAINNDAVMLGRPFSVEDTERGRRYALIGEQVRVDLFGQNRSPLGQEIQIGKEKYEIIGVLRRKDRSFLSSIGSAGGLDANSRVLIPYTRLQALAGNTQIDALQMEIASDAPASAAGTQVAAFLKRRHKGGFDYRVETMEQYVATANRILSGVSNVGIVAASVSLIVAGLGILNIMSTSVLERTREIGLRKAVGGSSQAILLQFLFEAMAISLLGGLIGLALGGASSYVIASIAKFPLMPSFTLILVALLVALLVGIASGIYPAYRAANMRPVEALRYE